MVRVGLPVPAEVPVALPAFSSVLADIGDEQSLTANLSTFSGHLKRIQVSGHLKKIYVSGHLKRIQVSGGSRRNEVMDEA
jgi:hypothetical protein